MHITILFPHRDNHAVPNVSLLDHKRLVYQQQNSPPTQQTRHPKSSQHNNKWTNKKYRARWYWYTFTLKLCNDENRLLPFPLAALNLLNENLVQVSECSPVHNHVLAPCPTPFRFLLWLSQNRDSPNDE